MVVVENRQDPYSLLGLSQATPLNADVLKAAYRRALLLYHPDKSPSSTSSSSISLDAIREAYAILSDEATRAPYHREHKETSPRPADVVSLDDFEEEDEAWTLACRCGGMYRLTTEQMERDLHLLGCSGCSELVWAGYDVVEDG